MRFLFKLTLLAIIGLALLPSFVPEKYRSAEASEAVQAPSFMEVALSAGMFIRDIGTICERQPAFCETSKELAVYTGVKAQEGFNIAYGMFSGEARPTATDLADATPGQTTAVQ